MFNHMWPCVQSHRVLIHSQKYDEEDFAAIRGEVISLGSECGIELMAKCCHDRTCTRRSFDCVLMCFNVVMKQSNCEAGN